MKRTLAVAIVVAGGAVFAWLWTRGAGGPSGSSEAPTSRSTAKPRQDAHVDAPEPARRAPPRAKRLAPDARQRLGNAITTARQRRQDAHAAEDGAPSRARLDSAYVLARMRDIFPFLKECYANALDDKPDLQGKIVVELAIGGEPDVGAVIEDSKILNNSTIRDASVLECVQETLHALELEPPEQGGQIVIVYPFKLAR